MAAPTRFGLSLARSNNQVGMALVAVLGWVATCDGHYDARERRFIKSIASGQLTDDQVEYAVGAATDGDLRDIQLACELLGSLDSRRKQLFVELAVGVAVSDGKLTVSENHVVRFLADFMGLNRGALDNVYQNHTGAPTPTPSDLGSADWWAARASSGGSTRDRTRSRATGSATAEAFSILGLAAGASKSEIRLAYRRLAKTHHPDKYESLGPEAVKAANETFKRIQAAYEQVKHG